jgi:hypothetical protein
MTHKKYVEILYELHENSFLTPVKCTADDIAKGLGHYSAYGSYWLSLSLIADGVEESRIEKFINYVEKWSQHQNRLKPRLLHLKAELECRRNIGGVVR